MEIGLITGIAKDDDRLICTVDFGADDAITAVLYGLSSVSEYPMIDDEVVVSRGDDENVIVATFRPVGGIAMGESIIYGRDSDGVVVSSVKLGNDGTVKINGGTDGMVETGNASDFVALSAKVDAHISAIDDVLRTWTPIPNDGGAALQTAYKLSVPSAPGSVASANLKAD